jgi:hypothetical protein
MVLPGKGYYLLQLGSRLLSGDEYLLDLLRP